MTQETAQVRAAANKLRTPLVATLRATIQQGQQLANAAGQTSTQAPSAAPNPSGQTLPVDQQRKQFEALASRFKQIAGATLPLSQEIILLDQASSNFVEWRQSRGP